MSKQEELTFYQVQQMEDGNHRFHYRFVSLYNGINGFYRDTRKEAEEDGEKHKAVVLAVSGGAQLLVAKERIKELEADIDAIQSEIGGLQEQRDKAEEKIQQLKEGNEFLQEQNTDLSKYVDKLKKEAAGLSKWVDEYKEKLAATEEDLKEVGRRCMELTEENDACKRERKETQVAIEELREKLKGVCQEPVVLFTDLNVGRQEMAKALLSLFNSHFPKKEESGE